MRLRLRGKAATVLPFVAGGRLLDVGCGSGRFLERHVALGWKGWGVEISPEAARYAREKRGLRVSVAGRRCAGPGPFPGGVGLTFCFGHLGLGPIMFVHAEKLESLPTGPGRGLRNTGS